MRPYANNPNTPKMRKALKQLAAGEQPACAGLPTRQRLVKFGLARWVTPGDVNDLRCLGGEGKLEITDLGREAVR